MTPAEAWDRAVEACGLAVEATTNGEIGAENPERKYSYEVFEGAGYGVKAAARNVRALKGHYPGPK